MTKAFMLAATAALTLAGPAAALEVDLGNFTVQFELPAAQGSTAVFDVVGAALRRRRRACAA